MADRSSLENESVGPYYISAVATLPKTRILKNENTFAIFDVKGDLYTTGNDELGIYHCGTRYLSRLLFLIGDTEEPLMLNSFIRKENDYLKVEMTNPDLIRPGLPHIKKSTIYIARTKFLDNCGCDEEICFSNYGDEPIDLPIAIEFDADYRDVFEIRGTAREARGEELSPKIGNSSVILGYRGLDHIERYTTLYFSEKPDYVSDHRAIFQIYIPPGRSHTLEIKFRFSEQKNDFHWSSFETGLKKIHSEYDHEKSLYANIHSSSDDFNLWLERSRNDLIMMTTTTSTGERYPYAGIPWYCTAFGRDGIWTALLCLWVNPDMAKQTLYFLARTQAKAINAETVAEPGKIFHEFRTGEMANLGEIPFGKYYGTVDATPLYLMLAGEYYDRTGDIKTIEDLWPSLLNALSWIDEYGDLDQDGFIEYRSDSEKGLINQGWKDSHDSISHSDGSEPEGPIALCEVQGYVYSAKRHAAKLALVMKQVELSEKLNLQAQNLKQRFDEAFWIPEMNTFALALDGKKRPCKVQSSNPGHLLYCGILNEDRVAPLAQTLMSSELFSGWGIRTLGTKEKRYNPISYHNGSVWPHDTTIIAMGLSRYGFKIEVEKIFLGLFRACTTMEHTRMPEVFCGFVMGPEPPTLYPVACSPQAWSAASVYGLMQALLGIEINAFQKKVRCFQPTLPHLLNEVRVRNLRVGEGHVDFAVVRYRKDVAVRLLGRTGEVGLIIEK